ncbi:hypothetical protein KFL_003180080 [Klebsormidium nitens]|uniref:FAR-17a/AIG1-like protein n=1 Tax=Klebsormidium nitens TaxID=105231 RepID=A0A1Y1IDT4_KLENI|nr:hypothetical protein KFL_003180080 [Klebsormidium nitens]|eukprot:GAQ86887.1 hypothetical protein KFL_003180080 [Klebsormidium nitens]
MAHPATPKKGNSDPPLRTFTLAFVFHLTLFCVYLYGYLWHFSDGAKQLPGSHGFGWFYRYLTFWGFSIQLVTWAFSLLTHLFPRWKDAKRISDLLASSVFGIANIITVLHWTLFVLIQGNPVEGELVDRPVALGILVHAVNALSAWLDVKIGERTFRYPSLRVSFGIATAYCAFILWCKFETGIFPYPFLNTWPQPEAFLVLLAVSMVLIYVFHKIGAAYAASGQSKVAKRVKSTLGKVS